jgi:hypothetical protein
VLGLPPVVRAAVVLFMKSVAPAAGELKRKAGWPLMSLAATRAGWEPAVAWVALKPLPLWSAQALTRPALLVTPRSAARCSRKPLVTGVGEAEGLGLAAVAMLYLLLR